jgi:hypothetical protein
MSVNDVIDYNHLAKELQEDYCVIKIWSKTCSPCIVFEPKYKSLANKYNNINFMRVSTDKRLFPPMPTPTTLIIRDGVILDKLTGGDIAKLETLIDKYL